MSRSRDWCFTINHWTIDDEAQVQRLPYKYLVYGRELGRQGTPHLQGYISLHHAKTFETMKLMLPRAHIEKRRGTQKQAADYCKKDGNFVELGERPNTQEEKGVKSKATWAAILKAAKDGNFTWIEVQYPKVWVHMRAKIESLYAPDTKVIDGCLQHEWWYGPSGTGKSKALWEYYPEHFEKALNKWWDGYRHEPVVAIEEWAPQNAMTASSLKRWADRYPFTGEIKGGTMQKIRPIKIIVLSNYTPQECFPMAQDLEPILRRFTVIKFPEERERVRFRAAFYAQNQILDSDMSLLGSSDATQIESDSDVLPELDLDFLLDDGV